MWLTTRTGIGIRAGLAAVINGLVLVCSVVIILTFFIAGFGYFSALVSKALIHVQVTMPYFVQQIMWLVGALVGLVWIIKFIRQMIHAGRSDLFAETMPVSVVSLDDNSLIEVTIKRLATQIDMPAPEVRIRTTSIPEAYTMYRPDAPIVTSHSETPVIVLSTGLIETLEAGELEAVLAHELAHIANDDLRLVTGLLVPLITAESLQEHTSFLKLSGLVFGSIAAVGVSVFTRGRELAADRASVLMTGNPGSLAAALERLANADSTKPTEDFRKHSQSLNAINVLPTLGPDRTMFNLQSTHPPVNVRIEQLRMIESE